jgi:hypothetical protein
MEAPAVWRSQGGDQIVNNLVAFRPAPAKA